MARLFIYLHQPELGLQMTAKHWLISCFLLSVHITRNVAQIRLGRTDNEEDKIEYAQFRDDVVVADAIFKGPYVGIARMIQRVDSSDSGHPTTIIAMRLQYEGNDSVSTNHLWHIEREAPSADDCDGQSQHYAPFGVTNAENYTIFCSSLTLEYCELGDIGSKSNLTTIGKDVIKWFTVPDLPLVGPWSVIGRSMSIQDKDMSENQVVCGNIQLNMRMTNAREVKIPVKLSGKFSASNLSLIRSKISRDLRIPLSRVQTAFRLNSSAAGTVEIPMLVFGAVESKENVSYKLKDGKIELDKRNDHEKLEKSGGKSEKDMPDFKGPLNARGPGVDQKPGRQQLPPIEPDFAGVADAIFDGPFRGIVRMTQKVSSRSSGHPFTKMIVRLRYAVNDSNTNNHIIHVEANPVNGNECGSNNTLYAPFMKNASLQANYTHFCSGVTPDLCESGDITSKAFPVSIGSDVTNTFSVPLLPIFGPNSVIGLSVSVRASERSSNKIACANLFLNERASRAKILKVPVKIPSTFTDDALQNTRAKISRIMHVPLSTIHTTVPVESLSEGCTLLEFVLFDMDNYHFEAEKRLAGGGYDLGAITPKGCTAIISQPHSDATRSRESYWFIAALLLITCFI